MRFVSLNINQWGIFKIVLMIVAILIADNIVVRIIETDMMALILVPLNLVIYFLFMPWIRKEATNVKKDEEKPQP